MSGETLSVRRHKSKRRRWCDWCFEPIEAGEVYVKAVGTWEGDFGQTAMHPECEKAACESKSDDDIVLDVKRSRGVAVDEREP